MILHKLHNGLRCLCEISTETAKHGRNRQPHNSLSSTLKMISLARMWDAKVFSPRLYAANLHR